MSKILCVDYSLFKREVKELILLSLFQIHVDTLLLEAILKMQRKLSIVSFKKYNCFWSVKIDLKLFVKQNCVIYAKRKLNFFSVPFFLIEQNGVHRNDENSHKYSFPGLLCSYF